MRCCRAWSHPFTAPVPTSSGRLAGASFLAQVSQVGAKNLAQVPFSLARDNNNVCRFPCLMSLPKDADLRVVA